MTATPLASALTHDPWDAVVIGAGPAGSTAATLLARRGHAVLLLDKAPFPRPKVCGGCLSPAALALLDHLGLARPALGDSTPLTHLRLHAGRARAHFPLAGAVIDRAVFDAALASAARRAGATVLDATPARVALPGDPRSPATISLTDAAGATLRVHARTVLAADGLAGTSLAGLPAFAPRAAPTRLARFGAGAQTDAPHAYPAHTLTMTVGRAGYVGAVRLPDGRLDIAAALNPRAARDLGGPGPAVASVYAGARLEPPADLAPLRWRGTPTLTRRRAAQVARVLALGDAASYVEPFTGEGIGWALADAAAVVPHAEALISGDPALCRWATTRDAMVSARERPCRALAWTLRHPSLTRAAVSLVSAFPRLASPLIDHVATPRLPALRRTAARAPA